MLASGISMYGRTCQVWEHGMDATFDGPQRQPSCVRLQKLGHGVSGCVGLKDGRGRGQQRAPIGLDQLGLGPRLPRVHNRGGGGSQVTQAEFETSSTRAVAVNAVA